MREREKEAESENKSTVIIMRNDDGESERERESESARRRRRRRRRTERDRAKRMTVHSPCTCTHMHIRIHNRPKKSPIKPDSHRVFKMLRQLCTSLCPSIPYSYTRANAQCPMPNAKCQMPKLQCSAHRLYIPPDHCKEPGVCAAWQKIGPRRLGAGDARGRAGELCLSLVSGVFVAEK
jgi:hypothetical protein